MLPQIPFNLFSPVIGWSGGVAAADGAPANPVPDVVGSGD
jgi:hypothetical protein